MINHKHKIFVKFKNKLNTELITIKVACIFKFFHEWFKRLIYYPPWKTCYDAKQNIVPLGTYYKSTILKSKNNQQIIQSLIHAFGYLHQSFLIFKTNTKHIHVHTNVLEKCMSKNSNIKYKAV